MRYSENFQGLFSCQTQVQTAMGHASVNTTTRYISPDQTEVLEGFKKLKS